MNYCSFVVDKLCICKLLRRMGNYESKKYVIKNFDVNIFDENIIDSYVNYVNTEYCNHRNILNYNSSLRKRLLSYHQNALVTIQKQIKQNNLWLLKTLKVLTEHNIQLDTIYNMIKEIKIYHDNANTKNIVKIMVEYHVETMTIKIQYIKIMSSNKEFYFDDIIGWTNIISFYKNQKYIKKNEIIQMFNP